MLGVYNMYLFIIPLYFLKLVIVNENLGKTMAAEAIGYDLGKAIKVVNCAQLVSKWVGETAKNIQAVFDEAKAVDAILVFDEVWEYNISFKHIYTCVYYVKLMSKIHWVA